MGVARPTSPISALAPMACPLPLCPAMAAVIVLRRATGSGSPTGRSTNSAEIWLPSLPPVLRPRTLTGTIARTVVVARTGSPRVVIHRRSAPVTMVSTTSLTVPPCSLRMAL